MSTFTPYDATCPSCGHGWTVHIAQGLHITRLPEIRATLVDGTFQIQRCPACGTPTVFEATMVYTDFDRREYIAVETTTADRQETIARHEVVFHECFDLGPSIAQDTGKHFKRRLVYGLRALREKIVLWDAGLDDRVVEAVKGDVLRSQGRAWRNSVLRISRVLDGGHLLFSVHDPLRRPAHAAPESTFATQLGPARDFVTAPASAYAARANDPAGIARDFSWLDVDWLVDVQDGLQTV